MMKNLLVVLLALCSSKFLNAQSSFDKAATEAFVLTRMAEKFHLQPKPLNDEFSIAVFDGLLRSLDDQRIFFTTDDIAKLQVHRSQIDEQIKNKQSVFLQTFTGIYKLRLEQVDTMINTICKTPFEFNSKESFTLSEDAGYPVNSISQRNKLRKLVKLSVMTGLLEAVMDSSSLSFTQQKKYIDSLEIVYRKKVMTSFKRSIAKDLHRPGGIEQLLEEKYCELIASYYDPHTNYLSLTGKENFDSELGQKSMMFGFGLDEDDDGGVSISKLQPGSPAYQSGQLNEDDKIISIQWQGKDAIDVSDASLSDIVEILDASNHDKVTINVQKADGSHRHVELAKAKMDDDSDGDKVKSFLLKGKKTVGYISLPAFYEDWENEDNNVNGCANDVAREIIKLKKEGIEALIFDVRYNGGGSVQEAIELAGIFIDAGPVGQIKDKGEKALTLKDVNRGTIYDGPLLLMVNGYSASASELVAATLQDYNRAVIVGSTTYGKATAQAVLPMDTTINLDKDFTNRKTPAYVKMTLSKLYRVNGATAQFAGVQPDIILPDIAEAGPGREADEPFAIPATGIEANKYYKPLPPITSINLLQAYARSVVDTAAFFKSLEQYIALRKAELTKKDISLNWKEALEMKKKFTQQMPSFSINKRKIFEVVNHGFDEQRLKGNENLKELHDTWKNFLESDPYLQVTYELALMMK
jgi:carboxyl-terminal processing protease